MLLELINVLKKPENLVNLQLNFKINTLKFRQYSLQLSSQ